MQPKIVIIGVSVVVVFDLLASFASQSMGFAYGWASIGSYIIYFLIGLLAARSAVANPVRAAAAVTAIAGLADASLGWWISWQIGPGKPAPDFVMTPARWVTTALIVVGLAAAVGAVGGLVGRRTKVNASAT